MPHVAVIGCGSIGRRHVGNLLALGCEVSAFDGSPEPLAALPDGVHCYTNADMVGDPPVFDAVVIATPWDAHLLYVEWAIERRLPFFVEKPLGSLEQLPRWREIATGALPVTTQVGYQCRFHPRAQAMKLLFPRPAHGSAACVVDMRTWPGVYGPLLLEASHEIDMAMFLGADAIVSGAWRVFGGWMFRMGTWHVSVRQLEGEYFRRWNVHSAASTTEGATLTFHSPEALGDEMYRAEMAHFLECVRENKPTSVPLADGLRVLEVVQQVESLCQSSQ